MLQELFDPVYKHLCGRFVGVNFRVFFGLEHEDRTVEF
jgi:hypothetical protein